MNQQRNAAEIAIIRARDAFNHGCIGNDCDLCVGIEKGVEIALAFSSNYIANNAESPTEVVFTNGRRVRGESLTVDFDSELSMDAKPIDDQQQRNAEMVETR